MKGLVDVGVRGRIIRVCGGRGGDVVIWQRLMRCACAVVLLLEGPVPRL